MTTIQIKIPNWLDKILAWPLLTCRRLRFGYPYRRFYLGEGEWTIVDSDIYYRFGNFKWSIRGNRKTFYAVRFVKTGPWQTTLVNLHREIMGAPAGLLVDHKNGDGLDNRRANLRIATPSQNSCNSRRDKSNTYSRYRGVSFSKRKQKWFAAIRVNGRKLWLGYFDNEIDAAKAYDEAAKKYHGEYACLNFP